jgi:hypothetical protein
MDDDGIWLVSVTDDDLADIVGYPLSGPDTYFLGGGFLVEVSWWSQGPPPPIDFAWLFPLTGAFPTDFPTSVAFVGQRIFSVGLLWRKLLAGSPDCGSRARMAPCRGESLVMFVTIISSIE